MLAVGGIAKLLADNPFHAADVGLGDAPFGLAQLMLQLGCFRDLAGDVQLVDVDQDLRCTG